MCPIADGYGRLHADFELVYDADGVLAMYERGIEPERIYYLSPTAEGLTEVLPLCRCVAASADELRVIDRAADSIVPIGVLLGKGGFDDPAALKSLLRALRYLSIRGCFVRADSEPSPALFSYGYQCAKRLSATLPAGVGFVGYLDALSLYETLDSAQRERFCRNAAITAAQNATAFYAKLLLS